jgi:hypothetical protein
LNPPWKVIEYELLHHSNSLAVAVARFVFGAPCRNVPLPDFFGLSSQFFHQIWRFVSPSFVAQRNQPF